MSYLDDSCLVHDKPGFESDRILNAKNLIVGKHWVTSEKMFTIEGLSIRVYIKRPVKNFDVLKFIITKNSGY